MHIEVDQSGKIEQLNKDTYIAFSNLEQCCVKLPKHVKQDIVYEYRTKIRFGRITKDSKAHKLALRTYREEEKPNRILTKSEGLTNNKNVTLKRGMKFDA